MQLLTKIESVAIRVEDETNGAETMYSIQVKPSSLIYSGDLFQIEFPEQIGLSANIVCGIGDLIESPLRKISCQRVGARGVHFLILDIDPDREAGELLEFTVKHVINSISTRPSSSFKNIRFFDYSINKNISEYSNKLIITNKRVGQLASKTASIRQTSYDASADSTIELQFLTNNPLPPDAAILVDVPQTIAQLYTDSSKCKIKLNGVVIAKQSCRIDAFKVVIKDAFSSFVTNDFVGKVQIYFEIRNPKNN